MREAARRSGAHHNDNVLRDARAAESYRYRNAADRISSAGARRIDAPSPPSPLLLLLLLLTLLLTLHSVCWRSTEKSPTILYPPTWLPNFAPTSQ